MTVNKLMNKHFVQWNLLAVGGTEIFCYISWVSDIFNSHPLHLAVKCTTKSYRAVNTFLLYYGENSCYRCLGK